MVKDELRIAELEKKLAEKTAALLQQGEELSVINSVQEALVEEMDMQAIYDLVGDKMQELFDAQALIIATLDHETATEHFNYTIENGERFYPQSRPYDKLRKSVIDSKKKVVINTAEEAVGWFGIEVIPGTKYMKSGVFVPLITKGNVTGYISLQNVDKEHAFTDSDIRLLETLANSMSSALQNARLLKETEQRTAELAVINSVQDALAKELDIQAIYDLVGNRIRDLFDAQVVGIATFDHANEMEIIHFLIEKGERYNPVPRPLNILRKHLIKTKEKILINKNFEGAAAAFGMNKVPGTEQPLSALYVPLVIGEKVTGYVSLQNIDRENAFSESDVRLMETLANSMGVALENARLFDETTRLLKETEQQKAELGVINSVQEGLAKELDMQAIYDLVGERIRELFNAQAVIIANFDHDTATESFKYLIEDKQRFYLASRPYDKLRQHLIINKQKIVINQNYEQAYAKFGLKTLPGTNMTKSAVFVPLIIGDKVNSYISLQNNEIEFAFSESDVRLLETLANSMSVALENARLFDETTRLLKETEQRTAELGVINSVQEGLAKELDIQGIYDLVGNKIREVFDAQGVIIATFEHDSGKEIFNYLLEKGERFNVEPRRYDKLRYQLIMTKQKILINSDMAGAFNEFGLKVVEGTEMPKSLLFVPLIVGNNVTSYVSLQHTENENAFSDSDVRLLETLANSMSVALENARLFDETTRLLKETEQRTAELSVINSVQEGLAQEMDMQGIYELVGEKIREIFDAQVIDISTYDINSNLIEDHYAFEKGDRTLVGTWEPTGFRKHVIDNGQLLMINKDLEKKAIELGAKVVHGEMPKSVVFVPMTTAGKVSGMISLQNLDKENAFSDSAVSMLTTLANSMSIALKSARRFDETNRLLKETEQRNAELAVINSVQDGLVREMDMQGIYELVGEKIREIFDAQVIDIVTYDRKTNMIEDRYAYEKGDRSLLAPREIKGFRKHVIETGELLMHNENVEQAMKDYNNEILIGDIPKSQVYVPLISGSEVNGVISLQNLDHEHAFSDSDVRLIKTLANTMSIALESARLFDETKRLLNAMEQRNAELAVINALQVGLVREMDMDGIYELVGEKIREIFDAQVIDIATYDPSSDMIEDRYAFEKGDRTLLEPRKPIGFRKHVIGSKKEMIINRDLDNLSIQYDSPVIHGEQPKSMIMVPLFVGSNISGIISLQNLDREDAFSESDIRLINTLANTMSIALESARLFDETKRLLKETEQRTAELGVINSVQDGLAKEMDIQGIYELVGEKIRKIFNAQVIDIVTYDKSSNQIEDRYAYENGDRSLVGTRPLKGFRKHVIDSVSTLVINNNMEAERSKYDQSVIKGEGAKSLVMVPMIAGGEINGVISLQNLNQENAFPDSDVKLLNTLANSMSVALENARLFDETNRLLKETEQRTAELAVINSIQEGLVREMDMQGIYDLVGDRVQTLFNAQAVIIGTFDTDYKTEFFTYVFENGERVKLDARPVNKLRQLLIDKKHTVYIATEEQAINEFDLTAVGQTKMPKSLLFVPLMTGIILRGYVSLQNIDIENAFSDSDIRLLETLANSMSVALENARLFDETNRLLKETEQRTAELAVINSVQDGLAKELDIQGIYDLVGDRLCDLFPDTQTLVIRTFDYDLGNESFQYAIEKGERMAVEPQSFMWASQQLIRTKKSIDIQENYVRTAQKFGGSGVTVGKPPMSAVFVPMIVGDIVKGSISLQNVDRENAFNASDLRLLTTITNSMSVALENARLFDETHRLLKETEQRTAELAVINSVQDGLVREMNMQAIYDLVGERICKLFDTQTVLIRTFDHPTEQENWQYVIEKGERLFSSPRPFNWANKKLIQDKQSLLINQNYQETARKFGGSGVSKGLPPKSALFIPMIVGDVVRGSVSLQNVEKENAFTEDDLRLLSTLTNSMSVALENARLFDESNKLLGDAKQRASELATVNNITQALASQINLEELINLVGDEIRQLFKANIVYLALLDKKTNIINFPHQFGDTMEPMQLGEGLTSKIIITGEPLLMNKDIQDLQEQMGIKTVGIPAASYLGVPISVGGENIGVLSVQSTEHQNRFTDDDLRLLNTIATSVGVAIRKATLFEEIHMAKMDAEEAKKTAEKANEAKSSFLSTVSHELRTPLTSVLGFAKIIKKRLEDKIFPITDRSNPKTEKTIKQIADNLDVVVSEGQRLTHLINDVLDLAKIEAGKMEWDNVPISIPEIAERAIAATTALFESSNLKLFKNIKTDLSEITGDKDKLIQVMVNLISNAVKFSVKGKVTCDVYQKNEEIIMSVTDTGIGIAPEDHAAVFEQFKQVGDTLTDKPKGTGLGLPICKEIVEHHDGRIWLESELGVGSTFFVALPVKKQTEDKRPIHLDDLVSQLKEQVAHSKLNVIGSFSTILVVDDDESIRSLLNQELGEAGYNIMEATNGKEALEAVRKQKPDLIILDIMMPEMNGFDVAAVLKNDPQTMDIPIIVLSIVQDKTRGFRIGVDRYLTKPIDTNLLFNEIGSLLEQGKSKKKVMIVDENQGTVNTLAEVLKTKGYIVTESDGTELMEKAVADQPDIIIMNSVLSGNQDAVKSLRFEKGLENVLFLVYQ